MRSRLLLFVIPLLLLHSCADEKAFVTGFVEVELRTWFKPKAKHQVDSVVTKYEFGITCPHPFGDSDYYVHCICGISTFVVVDTLTIDHANKSCSLYVHPKTLEINFIDFWVYDLNTKQIVSPSGIHRKLIKKECEKVCDIQAKAFVLKNPDYDINQFRHLSTPFGYKLVKGTPEGFFNMTSKKLLNIKI